MLGEGGLLMWRSSFWIIVFILTLSGCALTPDYERPETELPETWEQVQQEETRESIANLKWWEIYQDDTMTES